MLRDNISRIWPNDHAKLVPKWRLRSWKLKVFDRISSIVDGGIECMTTKRFICGWKEVLLRRSVVPNFHNSLFLHSFLSHIQISAIDRTQRDFYPPNPPQSPLLLQSILLPHPPLNSRPFRNPLNPLQQMRKRLHLLFRKPSKFPPFNPRPSADIRYAVFAFTVAGEVFAG